MAAFVASALKALQALPPFAFKVSHWASTELSTECPQDKHKIALVFIGNTVGFQRHGYYGKKACLWPSPSFSFGGGV